MARYTRTQQILRQQAAAMIDPAALGEMLASDLSARAADLERAEEARARGDVSGAQLWAGFARGVERRIRKRADRIITERRHALELEDQQP